MKAPSHLWSVPAPNKCLLKPPPDASGYMNACVILPLWKHLVAFKVCQRQINALSNLPQMPVATRMHACVILLLWKHAPSRLWSVPAPNKCLLKPPPDAIGYMSACVILPLWKHLVTFGVCQRQINALSNLPRCQWLHECLCNSPPMYAPSHF